METVVQWKRQWQPEKSHYRGMPPVQCNLSTVVRRMLEYVAGAIPHCTYRESAVIT